MTQPVSDLGSNAEENIVHAARVIGRSDHRKSVFDAIYTGRARVKTVSSLMLATNLPRTRVLDAAKRLVDNHIVNRVSGGSELAFEKIGFFQANKRKILAIADKPERIDRIPTKRNPYGNQPHRFTLVISPARADQAQVFVDDVSNLARVQKIPNNVPELGNELSEEEFKLGLQRCIGEPGRFKDWGGEVADIYTTHLTVRRRRRSAAIALKGPGTRGKLTPGKMGKNGDQLQRLFEAPAEVFFVQYVRQVDLGVYKQMELLAITKSLLTGSRILWGVLDGFDSRRITMAYPKQFKG